MSDDEDKENTDSVISEPTPIRHDLLRQTGFRHDASKSTNEWKRETASQRLPDRNTPTMLKVCRSDEAKKVGNFISPIAFNGRDLRACLTLSENRWNFKSTFKAVQLKRTWKQFALAESGPVLIKVGRICASDWVRFSLEEEIGFIPHPSLPKGVSEWLTNLLSLPLPTTDTL
ncbi:UNVERIFIED_CONTAM: hypothetical protein K2H54_035197 [Gekko kuhli]